MVTELICNLILKRPNSLGDLSAVVTGVILAFSLPPAIPVWAAVIGSIFSIAIGKMVFGGLGANTFNPAMVGRAFLTACFGMMMTAWTVPATTNPEMPGTGPITTVAENKEAIIALGVDEKALDATTTATPLAWSKKAIKESSPEKAAIANSLLRATVMGNTGGCLGETSVIALAIGGIYLLIRKTITLHIPAAVLLGAFVYALIAKLMNSETNMLPLLHLTSGGMLICAFFIATDPVTIPITYKGMWIFGLGTGALIMLIRTVGGPPEGVMYAILVMNSLTPLIDRFCKLTPLGGIKDAK